MTLVVDASVVYAFLVEPGPEGVWARRLLRNEVLAAPSLVLYEVANVLRKHSLNEVRLTRSQALRAHGRLLALGIVTVPYRLFARRAWELRENLTILDASYVAFAEAIDAPLVTLDARSARAPGVRCEVRSFT
jgi:predicted nucleic acid-binding protein